MVKFYLYLILLISSSVALIIYENGYRNHEYANEIWTLASTGLAASIGALISFLLENWGALKLSIRCLLFKRNDPTYVSLSYLFRIKLKGRNKYLMVRGSKIKGQYQPVGGVYKKYASLEEKWQKWGALEAKNEPENSDDLRFTVKRKFIPEIRKWFYQRKNREIDVWREFYEEILISGILPKEDFTHIKPEFLYSKEERLIFRKGRDEKQLLIYDIYTINMTPAQELVLEQLYTNAAITHEYAFVDEKDLDKEIFINNEVEHQLGFHARYLKS